MPQSEGAGRCNEIQSSVKVPLQFLPVKTSDPQRFPGDLVCSDQVSAEAGGC